jgi:hypothetical protein
VVYLRRSGNINNWHSGANDEGIKAEELITRAAAARSYASIAIHNVDEGSTPGSFNDSIHRFMSTRFDHLLGVESNTLSRLGGMIYT